MATKRKKREKGTPREDAELGGTKKKREEERRVMLFCGGC